MEAESANGTAEPSNYQHLFKIILVGGSTSGKTAFLQRLVTGSFQEKYIATIGVDFALKVGRIQSKRFKLQLWDTAGQERFRNITTSYYRGAHAVFVLVDLTEENSIETAKNFLRTVQELAGNNCLIMVLGTKSDLPTRVIMPDDLRSLADSFGADYMEVSPKTGENVEAAVAKAIQKLLKSASGTSVVPWWNKIPKIEWENEKPLQPSNPP